ncbi:MAG: GYD domain-containing protein [Dehalococcoidia bacterium]|nr:MAG: GYD domain-containing protein [Dehalococcoidia bacterium]
MPNYIVLYRFTDQGLQSIKGTVKRAREVRAENEKRGFKVLGMYWTQGRYDLVAVMDAPSEEAMTAGLFNVAEAGNVHSETLRAFTEAEMEKALGAG